MTVQQLIEKLREMPADAAVMHAWDGYLRTEIQHVWLSRDGQVATADFDEVVYDTGARPLDAPTEEEHAYWKTPRKPQVTS
jgi:hypothetical protein